MNAKLFCVISFCQESAISLSTISLCSEYIHKVNGTLVIFNKTGSTKFLSTIKKLFAPNVLIYNQDLTINLYQSVFNWASDFNFGKNAWVQILAEDDTFIFNESVLDFIDGNKFTAYISPMVYLYKSKIVTENLGLLESSLSANCDFDELKHVSFGDSSWHSIVRSDVLTFYSKWVNQLPIALWHISNSFYWCALTLGHIGFIKGFVYCKESYKWESEEDQSALMQRQYKNLFGNVGGWEQDHTLYWVGVLSLLFYMRPNGDKVKCELAISLVVIKLCRILKVLKTGIINRIGLKIRSLRLENACENLIHGHIDVYQLAKINDEITSEILKKYKGFCHKNLKLLFSHYESLICFNLMK